VAGFIDASSGFDGREVYLKVGVFAAKMRLNDANIANLVAGARENSPRGGARG
jgi:hypothetical protein